MHFLSPTFRTIVLPRTSERRPAVPSPTQDLTATLDHLHPPDPASASVVVCSYSLERYDQLLACVASVRAQLRRHDELIVVVDHNPALFGTASADLPDVRVVASRFERGLSGARNTGVLAATGAVVLFLDDDAVAEPDWLDGLMAPFADPFVLGTAGGVEAAWQTGRPAWFPREFDWVVGCSYRGLPESVAQVRNPIGASMSFRRHVLVETGLFRTGVGRVGANLAGCEETELSIRAAQLWPDHRIMYVPDARVRHFVPAKRATIAYFIRRCFGEGRSKALLARIVGPRRSSASERRYMLTTLPSGVVRGAVDSVRTGRLHGIQRSVAIVLGFTATMAGYGRGVLAARLPKPALATDAEG